MSLQIYLSASALLINLTHKFFWYSNPSLDVVLAQLLCGGAAKEGTKLYCTVLYCTVLYCTVLCCAVLYCTVLYLLRKVVM